MTNETLQKAKECKSAEELLALAKENGIEMTAEEAAGKFAAINNVGELSDDELENAAGGGCATHGIAMPDRYPKVGQVFTCKSRFNDSHDACSKCGSIYFHCTGHDKPAERTLGRFYGSCTNCGRAEDFIYSEGDEWEFTLILG